MAGDTAFQILRPYCLKVAEHPSVSSLNKLHHELQKVSSDQLQLVQEYIIFPLKLALLRDKRQDSDTIALVNCLRSLLSRTEVTNWQLFMDLFLKLFLLISSKEKEIKVYDCSEDLKLSVVECVKTLVERTPDSIKLSLYEATFCPALGHSVFILLQLSQNESLRSLRVVSTRTVTLLFGLTSDPLVESGGSCPPLVRARLAAFLPGICIGMAQVAVADVKQGQAVTVAALETWTKVVVCCLCDPDEEKESQNTAKPTNRVPRVPEVKRTAEWINSTASKLQILLKRLLTLVSHPHHKVRLALTNLSGMLLLNCRSCFQDSFVPLLECLISLTHDNTDVVSERSKALVARLSAQDLQRPLVDTLEDSLYSLATRLPRLLRNTDDSEKVVALNLLVGYITILDSRTESLLRSSAHLKRLSQALIHVAQPDTKNVPLVFPSIGVAGSSCLKFQHFTESSILLSLKQSCSLLGLHGDACVLVDCLLNNIQNSKSHQEGAVLVMNFVVAGVAQRKVMDEECKHAIKHAFQVYTSSNLWEDDKKIVLKGILLEGLTVFAQVMEDESLHLKDLLCLFLEQAGVNSTWVAQCAKSSLSILAQILKHSCVDDLVFANADYLVHMVAIKLVHFSEYPALPGLLRVLFESVSPESLLIFQDIIKRVLSAIDMCYGSKTAVEFLKVLCTLVNAIQCCFPSAIKKQEAVTDNKYQETSLTLLNFLVEHERTLKVSRCFDGNEFSPDTEDALQPEHLQESDADTETTKVCPLHVQMTCQILERCVHLLRSDEVPVILTTLEVIMSGLKILTEHEDDLLPMVHKLWGPYQDLFKPGNNPIVISKAFEALLLMAGICKSFIYRRTLEGVWPHLLRILEKEVQRRKQRQNSTQQMYKLTLLLLSKLGELALVLQFEGSVLNPLCQLCLSFLETDSRTQIVKACEETLLQIQKVDPGAIWWWITRATCVPACVPPLPGAEFRPVRLPPTRVFPEASVILIQEILKNN